MITTQQQSFLIFQYISWFPTHISEILSHIRQIILSSHSDIQESMSYGMPAYKLFGKPLVYFAGYEHHIWFYATPNGHEQFKQELSPYKQGKWSVQFPLDEPMPYDLMQKIINFRIEENTRLYKK
jgi:uncharacterized protein YdhG (YjbR/CyaY superfamily)